MTAACELFGEEEFGRALGRPVPIRLFNGSHLPMEADRSADGVVFNSVLRAASVLSRVAQAAGSAA